MVQDGLNGLHSESFPVNGVFYAHPQKFSPSKHLPCTVNDSACSLYVHQIHMVDFTNINLLWLFNSRVKKTIDSTRPTPLSIATYISLYLYKIVIIDRNNSLHEISKMCTFDDNVCTKHIINDDNSGKF